MKKTLWIVVLGMISVLFLGALAVDTVERLKIEPQTISSWDELLEKYLYFRIDHGPIVPPTHSYEQIALQMSGGDWSFIDGHWQFKFPGGTYYIDSESKLGQSLKLPLHLLAYEDVQRGEIIFLSSEDGIQYKGEALYNAPEFTEFDIPSALTAEERAEEHRIYLFADRHKTFRCPQIRLKSL